MIWIGYRSYSVLLFSRETYERWGHLGFLERGDILEKGGGMTPLTNYVQKRSLGFFHQEMRIWIKSKQCNI